MTTDTLLGAYQLAGAVEEKNDSYLFTEAFARDFKAALGQQKYITLISAEDMTGVDMEGVSMSGLQDAVFTFYEDVFKGFETGMVKKISGGYAIQADGQQVAQLMINMLDFIGKNPEQVLNATEAYMMTVMDSMNASAEDKEETNVPIFYYRDAQDGYKAGPECNVKGNCERTQHFHGSEQLQI